MVRVEWWVLMKKGSNSYEQCLYEVAGTSGNVFWYIENNGLRCTYFVLFSFTKNTINKSRITIFHNCSFGTKVNLEATNASNNFKNMLVTLIKYLFFLYVFFSFKS
jgi:hypothetical protein